MDEGPYLSINPPELIAHGSQRLLLGRPIRITHADLTAAAASETLDLAVQVHATLDAMVIDVFYRLNTEFSGGTVGTCTAEVGDSPGASNTFLVSGNVFTGAGTGWKALGIAAKGWTAGDTVIHAATVIPQITFRVTGDTVANLTAGELDLYFVYMLLPDTP